MNGVVRWLGHVLDVVARSRLLVVGVCPYPVVNAAAWNALHRRRWDHGLIRENLTADPALSARIMAEARFRQARAA